MLIGYPNRGSQLHSYYNLSRLKVFPLINKAFFLVIPILAFSAASVHGQAQDSDHDGIPDALDKCPNTAQLKKLPADFKFAPAVNPERLKPGAQAYPVDKDGCEFDTDGDGVIVVPRAKAKEVAEYSKAVIESDKAGRRELYKKLGLPPDDSIK